MCGEHENPARAHEAGDLSSRFGTLQVARTDQDVLLGTLHRPTWQRVSIKFC